jgi:hypothetical protein
LDLIIVFLEFNYKLSTSLTEFRLWLLLCYLICKQKLHQWIMSNSNFNVRLIPIHNKLQPPIPLQTDRNTILSRNNTFQITDRRISRRHGEFIVSSTSKTVTFRQVSKLSSKSLLISSFLSLQKILLPSNEETHNCWWPMISLKNWTTATLFLFWMVSLWIILRFPMNFPRCLWISIKYWRWIKF